MVYIEKEKREKLDDVVRLMLSVGIKADGDLNYILHKFCKCSVKESYIGYKNFIAELHETEEEIRRRFLIPLIESKKDENGDIDKQVNLSAFFQN